MIFVIQEERLDMIFVIRVEHLDMIFVNQEERLNDKGNTGGHSAKYATTSFCPDVIFPL